MFQADTALLALTPEERAIVNCLKLFAKRGLALRQEQANKTANALPLAGETLTAEQLKPALGEVQP